MLNMNMTDTHLSVVLPNLFGVSSKGNQIDSMYTTNEYMITPHTFYSIYWPLHSRGSNQTAAGNNTTCTQPPIYQVVPIGGPEGPGRRTTKATTVSVLAPSRGTLGSEWSADDRRRLSAGQKGTWKRTAVACLAKAERAVALRPERGQIQGKRLGRKIWRRRRTPQSSPRNFTARYEMIICNFNV